MKSPEEWNSQNKNAFRLMRRTKTATVVAVVTRLLGYGCAACTVVCLMGGFIALSLALVACGTVIIAGGAAVAELLDMRTGKLRRQAQREERKRDI